MLFVLLDPFGTPPGACIPTVPGIPSKKFQVFARGTMICGSNGRGYIVVNPFSGVSSNTRFGYFSSSSGSVIPSISTDTNATNTQIFSNSPYAMPFNTGTAKLVACGIRVKYVGQITARAGMTYSEMSPGHQSLNAQTPALLGQDAKCFIKGVDDDWVNCLYLPTASADYNEYQPYPAANTSLDGTTSGNGLIAIIVDGAAAGAPFYFEVFGHYEIMSPTIPDLTPTHADMTGLSAVQNLVGSVHSWGWSGSQLDTGRIWNTISSYGASALSHFGAGIGVGVMQAMSRQMRGNSNLLSGRNGPIVEEMN